MAGRRRQPGHPSQATAWSVDFGNEQELAGHGITEWEVRELFENDPRWAVNKRDRAGAWKMMGVTNGGRRLTIVVRYDAEKKIIRPITGWVPTRGELARYF